MLRTIAFIILLALVWRYGRYLWNNFIQPATQRDTRNDFDLKVDFDPNQKKKTFTEGEYIDYKEIRN